MNSQYFPQQLSTKNEKYITTREAHKIKHWVYLCLIKFFQHATLVQQNKIKTYSYKTSNYYNHEYFYINFLFFYILHCQTNIKVRTKTCLRNYGIIKYVFNMSWGTAFKFMNCTTRI